jgi:hypothetical protein
LTKSTKIGSSEVDPENVQPIIKHQLKDSDKAELEAHMKHYEELFLASYGQTKSGVFKKNPLPTPKQVTFSADPEGLQDMMTKAMHQTMIDQSKVFANTIQNAIIDALKKGAEGGYLGPAYYQPNKILYCSSKTNRSTRQLMIQQQKLHHLHKMLLVLHRMLSRFRIKVVMEKIKILLSRHKGKSIIQDQMLAVQNQHKYSAMRDPDGKLAGWDLPRDHFETNISNFFEPVPEEVPKVKYPQSYQATFGGTPGLCT